MKLSRLKKVDLRKAWAHEALDFTNWLAQPENLELLSEEIGIEIELIQTEASVGNFNVDILAEEENTGRKIIIENQLEATDHDHLGKIITYASGYDAEIIIWIVKDVREEHKQAIDWLNEHTDGKINFFAIKMELWQIGDSPIAPKFQTVSEPNEWAKVIKMSNQGQNLTETKQLQLQFWNAFNDYASKIKTAFRTRKAMPQHWYDISVGSSEAHIAMTTNSRSEEIACEFYISQSKELFEALSEHKEEIEKEIGAKLEWMPLEGRRASRIKLTRKGNINDTDNWEEYFEWLVEKVGIFHKVFGSMLKKLS